MMRLPLIYSNSQSEKTIIVFANRWETDTADMG